MKQFHISEVFIFLNVLFEEGRVVRLFISWIKPTLSNRLKGRVSPDFRQQFFFMRLTHLINRLKYFWILIPFHQFHLTGTVSQDFLSFVLLKRFDLGPIWTGKNSFANFFVFAKIFAKNMCLRSCCLCWHCVSTDNDYANIVSA